MDRFCARVRLRVPLTVAVFGMAMFGLAACGADEPEPRGTIRLTVQGLAGGDLAIAGAQEPRPIIDLRDDPAASVEFVGVGNGTYSRSAPARSYKFYCNLAGDAGDRYDIAPLDPDAGTLTEGGVLAFTCGYTERARLTLVFEGLGPSIPGDWGIGTFTEQTSGSETHISVGRSGQTWLLSAGTYNVACNALVGNDDTGRWTLASISATIVELAPGAERTVTCVYQPEN